MRHAAAARLALPFPTIFNLLGPLTNPAGADRQVMGVYADRFILPMARTLATLGSTRAIVLHSTDGMDELSVSAPTRLAEVRGGSVEESELDPRALGIAARPRSDLEVSSLEEAARAVRAVLAGEPGARRDAVLLATAAGLRVSDIAEDWREGLRLAAEAIDSGAAAGTLSVLAAVSHAS
jgi:anthranilate phosphoribosyltransferase